MGWVTLGVDLASQPRHTAICRLAGDGTQVVVEDLRVGVDDDALVEAIAAADVDCAGLDVPLGWPDAFVAAVGDHHAAVPHRADDGRAWAEELRSLRYRVTDHDAAAALGRWPLSVSTDLIGVVALRAIRVTARLAALGVDVRRDGAGRVAEVYPAGCLSRWGLPSRGYKGATGGDARVEIVRRLQAEAPWLVVDPVALARSDHAIDTVMAALGARSVTLGGTARPATDQAAAANREGWIHLPIAGLNALV